MNNLKKWGRIVFCVLPWIILGMICIVLATRDTENLKKSYSETENFFAGVNSMADMKTAQFAPSIGASDTIKHMNGFSNSSKAEPATQSSATPQQEETGLKLTRSVDMDLEVPSDQDLEPTVAAITGAALKEGGYSSYSKVKTDESYAYADLELCVPKQNVDRFLEYVEGGFTVISFSDRVEDITSRYANTESRLKIKETTRDKYLSCLEKAETVSEVLEIESRLNSTIEDIESSQATLKSLDKYIDFTRITITIQCHDLYQEPSFAEKIQEQIQNILAHCGG